MSKATEIAEILLGLVLRDEVRVKFQRGFETYDFEVEILPSIIISTPRNWRTGYFRIRSFKNEESKHWNNSLVEIHLDIEKELNRKLLKAMKENHKRWTTKAAEKRQIEYSNVQNELLDKVYEALKNREK